MPSPMIDAMPLYPTWTDIALRLLLVTLASALIGIDREAGGHAAGFRTTVLVGLAACLTMIQGNILLSVSGKTGSFFAQMDILRFPLGVLTGVGFIGAGAILRRGSLVTGITTAATLWMVTVIGLCIGGGQLVVGCIGAVTAFLVLTLLKRFDDVISRQRKARLTIALPAPSEPPDIEPLLRALGCTAWLVACRLTAEGEMAVTYELRWKSASHHSPLDLILQTVRSAFKVTSFELASVSG